MKKIRNIFRGNEGFTLIELLIVIVILGVLAAIAVPNLAGLSDGAEEKAVKANARTLEVELAAFRVNPEGKTIPSNPSGEVTSTTDWEDFRGMVALIDQENVKVNINNMDSPSATELNGYKITISGDFGDDIVISSGSASTTGSTT